MIIFKKRKKNNKFLLEEIWASLKNQIYNFLGAWEMDMIYSSNMQESCLGEYFEQLVPIQQTSQLNPTSI